MRHHSFQHFCQLGSQMRIFHSAREKNANSAWHEGRRGDLTVVKMLQELCPSIEEQPAVANYCKTDAGIELPRATGRMQAVSTHN